MMMSLLPLFLLSLLLPLLAESAAPMHRDLILLLDGYYSDHPTYATPLVLFTYPLRVSSNASLSLQLNITDSGVLPLYSQPNVDFVDDNYNALTATPTPATPTQLLIAHSAYNLVQYNTVRMPNASGEEGEGGVPQLTLGAMQAVPSDWFEGVGDFNLLVTFMFHVDKLSSYFSLAWVRVLGSSSTFHMYLYRDPEKLGSGTTPVLQWQSTLPSDSNLFGLIGQKVAIDQPRGLVYVSLAFWQSSNPKFNCAWLLQFNAVDNYIAHNVTYPSNVTGLYDYSVSLAWSDLRQQLYSTVFSDTIWVEAVDHRTGASRRLLTPGGVHFDLYSGTDLFDDEMGVWYFFTYDEFASPTTGAPYILYSWNIDTNTQGPTNRLMLPSFGHALWVAPPPIQAQRQVEEEVEEEEEVVAKGLDARRRRAKAVKAAARDRQLTLTPKAQQE